MSAPNTPATKTILVTHALPYANGPLHIGHLLGYIQSDIWVRARRMAGDTVHFVAADDVHGTPIMLAAEKVGMTPEDFIRGVYDSHVRDFAGFRVDHDYYYTTHSDENRELAELVYARLKAGEHIAVRSIRQLFDPLRQMFLPDRYVKGICPNCGTPDQYGDNCENCGATYAPTDLKDPRSVLSGATPELRDSEHYFFKVGDFAAMLQDWLGGRLTDGVPVVHSSVAAKLKEWLDAEGGVRDWDISRDAPYFGFPIPDAPGKFFYVWLDAPIGYLASFKKYCASDAGAKNGLNAASFDAFMQTANPDFDASAEMHHFLGKDIVNFHGLFWPAMLKGAALRTPDALHVNGYLTVNGEKMSKSRGTFVMARTYLDAGLDADYLRYYFATMLTAAPIDLDLDLKAFEERVNSHLVGKFVNLASRAAGFVTKFFDGKLHIQDPAELASTMVAWGSDGSDDSPTGIPALYEKGDYAGVVREVMRIADFANQKWDHAKPWLLAKDGSVDALEKLQSVCTDCLSYFYVCCVYLKPICPSLVSRAETLFKLQINRFSDSKSLPREVEPFEHLLSRVDPKKIEAMIEASKETLKPAETIAVGAASGAMSADNTSKKSVAAEVAPTKDKTSPTPDSAGATPGLISIDDFAKLDLRVGKVLACEFVDGSDKLLRFELDAGELGKRQIFSGIRAAYGEPEKLVGRNVVFIANLAPRKMRFGVSEGMILSAGSGGADLFLLGADSGATPGMPVK